MASAHCQPPRQDRERRGEPEVSSGTRIFSVPAYAAGPPLHMDTTRSEPTRLNVVTFPQQTTQPAQHDCAGDLSLQEGVVATVRGIVTIVPDPCSGSYLCDCPTCVKDRERLAARGARTRVPQPWDTRRAA